ncbi:hypothetical protein MKI84_01190 [Ancylobacter sp. A5.8]|uniref:hypothetical protein n=1 Tax=Ancylobacter gelatini TaxID=2919920 RepID=UPI001F4E1262|nr:hypothetical protein [Ancylobacter gelatini]MCJ8141527.1 hypothetical protein [Ancylobacter gelatini]
MIKRTLATLTTAAFVLSSAAAFAAGAPASAPPAATPQAKVQTTAQATPTPIKVAAQTSKKSCEKEWTTGHKAGKLNGLGQKDFLSKCMKGA